MHKNKLNSSIIIPFYNGKGFIFDLMESLKRQTRYPDEIIIVDDGSFLEESIKILKEIKEKYRDILIINQENQGISGAMTTGAKNAIGDIIFQMDHDDLIDEEYIEKYMKIFEDNEDIDGVTSQYASFLDGLDHTKKENINFIYKPEGLVIPKGFFENCLGGANSAYRRTSIEKIGYWDKRFSSFQDWGMWLKFVENNLKQYIIPEVLYYYRIRNDSDLRTVAQEFDIYSEIRMSMNEIFERNSNQYNLRQIIQKMHKKYASDVKLCNDNLNQKEQLIQQQQK